MGSNPTRIAKLMNIPKQKHLYQARAILRRLRLGYIDHLEECKNSEDPALISHFADRIKKVSDAVAILELHDLDGWAKFQMGCEDRADLEREYEINFPKS